MIVFNMFNVFIWGNWGEWGLLYNHLKGQAKASNKWQKFDKDRRALDARLSMWSAMFSEVTERFHRFGQVHKHILEHAQASARLICAVLTWLNCFHLTLTDSEHKNNIKNHTSVKSRVCLEIELRYIIA